MPAVEIRVPGDKSIAHRALILGALAEGESVIDEVPAGQDVRSTESCLQDLGVDIDHAGGMRRVQGAGPGAWRSPARPLDCQNSGTTMRLLTGVLAGSAITATLTGDASLRRRPMARVVDPLRAMGARIELRNGTPPLRVEGTPLSGGRHRLPVPSAQVKSALLLAGLLATGETVVEEPVQTRDHTERLLRAMGARLSATGTGGAGGSLARRAASAPAGDPRGFLVRRVLVWRRGNGDRAPACGWSMSASTRAAPRFSGCCGRWGPKS